MHQLESLDHSQNKLREEIPLQLAKLTFLEFLDLSNNQLGGKIPACTQISTFTKESFMGNKGLWRPPLTMDNKARLSPPQAKTIQILDMRLTGILSVSKSDSY